MTDLGESSSIGQRGSSFMDFPGRVTMPARNMFEADPKPQSLLDKDEPTPAPVSAVAECSTLAHLAPAAFAKRLGIEKQLRQASLLTLPIHGASDASIPTVGSPGLTSPLEKCLVADMESRISSYIICTNPRSGSWLLSEGLAATSVAGNPREWFNKLEEERQRSQWGIEYSAKATYATYLDHIMKLGKTSNGIFGLKLHYYQFAELPEKMGTVEKYRGLAISQLMSSAFPNTKYIWLKRRDKTRQAISYHRASRSDVWWLMDDVTPHRREGSIDNPSFDAQAIQRIEDRLLRNDRNWQLYFESNAIAPLIIDYEDLSSDYAGNVVKVLRWLNIPDAEAVPIRPSRLKRQSDSQTEDWLARYLNFKAEAELRKPLSNEASAISSTATRAPSVRTDPEGPAVALGSPLFEQFRRSLDVLPDVWKRWIGRNKLLKVQDSAIVDVLVRNGYSRELAVAEIAKAQSNPYLHAGAESQQHLNKALSLLRLFQSLDGLRPGANAIERRFRISRDEFLDRYYSTNRPVIIQGLMSGWRAMAEWTPTYLKSKAGDEQVEVMAGRNADPDYELNSQKHRRNLRFADYVDMVYSGNVTNDYYLVANNSFFKRPGVRPLLEDFTFFEEYLNPATADGQTFFWFGPAGTVTPLHHDPCNILLAQVVGRKRFKLVPANQWEYVHNNVGVFSSVDCERPDFERWPQFRNATVYDIVLNPGEVLFMPVGWWHHVRTLDVGIMISFTNFVFPNHYEWPAP